MKMIQTDRSMLLMSCYVLLTAAAADDDDDDVFSTQRQRSRWQQQRIDHIAALQTC